MAQNSWNGWERKLLFLNLGHGKFDDIARSAGCDDIRDGRGVALADFNHDGKLDIVINNNAAAPTIYLNRLPATGNWFRCNLIGSPSPTGGEPGSNRDALGAKATLDVTIDGQPHQIVRWMEAGSGYAAQSESTLHFGVGASNSIDSLTVVWPSGRSEKFGADQLRDMINHECRIEEGRGITATVSSQPEAATAAQTSVQR